MILKFSNTDFDFKPWMEQTEKLLFRNQKINNWVIQQIIQGFDEIYVILAAFFLVCDQNDNLKFAYELNVFIIQYIGAPINPQQLLYQITSMESIIGSFKYTNKYADTDQIQGIHSLKNRYRTPAKPRRQADYGSVSQKSKGIKKSPMFRSSQKINSNRHKKLDGKSIKQKHKVSQSLWDQNDFNGVPSSVRSIFEQSEDKLSG